MKYHAKPLLVILFVVSVLLPFFSFNQFAQSFTTPAALLAFWIEDFDQLLTETDYFIFGSTGSALVDSDVFLLAQAKNYQHGRIFFLQNAFMNKFEAEFDFYLGAENGSSDGLAFHFCPVYDYPASDGGSLNANCPNGYFIALDTYNEMLPDKNEIYLAKGNVDNRLVLVEVARMDDGQWRSCHISFDNGTLTVAIEGETVIDSFQIPAYKPFGGYFGFSAATGGGYGEKKVDNIEINAQLLYRAYLPLMIK